MHVRELGKSGLKTPPLILGGNVFGWTIDQATSFTIFDAFVSGGGRLIDTADAYSAWVPGNRGGESETIIGAWLAARGRRDDIEIATKVGMEVDGKKGLAPSRIIEAVDASLRRLRTNFIDLYFAHIDDTDTSLEATLIAFDELVKSGKVRAIGASNYTAERLQQALETSRQLDITSYTVLQPHYNLLEREKFEGELQKVCVKHDIAAVPYFGLAAGFLTGKYRSKEDLDGKVRGSLVEGYLNDRGLAVLGALDRVGTETGATPAQISLAWLAAQPAVVAPIASATTPAQLEELLGAMRLNLTPDQLALLDKASEAPRPVPEPEDSK